MDSRKRVTEEKVERSIFDRTFDITKPNGEKRTFWNYMFGFPEAGEKARGLKIFLAVLMLPFNMFIKLPLKFNIELPLRYVTAGLDWMSDRLGAIYKKTPPILNIIPGILYAGVVLAYFLGRIASDLVNLMISFDPVGSAKKCMTDKESIFYFKNHPKLSAFLGFSISAVGIVVMSVFAPYLLFLSLGTIGYGVATAVTGAITTAEQATHLAGPVSATMAGLLSLPEVGVPLTLVAAGLHASSTAMIKMDPNMQVKKGVDEHDGQDNAPMQPLMGGNAPNKIESEKPETDEQLSALTMD